MSEYLLQRKLLRTPAKHHAAILGSNANLPNRFADHKTNCVRIPPEFQRFYVFEPPAVQYDKNGKPMDDALPIPYVALNQYNNLPESNYPGQHRSNYELSMQKFLPYMSQTTSDCYLEFKDKEARRFYQVIDGDLEKLLIEWRKSKQAADHRALNGALREKAAKMTNTEVDETLAEKRNLQKSGDRLCRKKLKKKNLVKSRKERHMVRTSGLFENDPFLRAISKKIEAKKTEFYAYRSWHVKVSLMFDSLFKRIRQVPGKSTEEFKTALPIYSRLWKLSKTPLLELSWGHVELSAIMSELCMRRIEKAREMSLLCRRGTRGKFEEVLKSSVKKMMEEEGLRVLRCGGEMEEEVWGGDQGKEVRFTREVSVVLQRIKKEMEEKWREEERIREQKRTHQKRMDAADSSITMHTVLDTAMDIETAMEPERLSTNTVTATHNAYFAVLEKSPKKRKTTEDDEDENPSGPSTPKKRKTEFRPMSPPKTPKRKMLPLRNTSYATLHIRTQLPTLPLSPPTSPKRGEEHAVSWMDTDPEWMDLTDGL